MKYFNIQKEFTREKAEFYDIVKMMIDGKQFEFCLNKEGFPNTALEYFVDINETEQERRFILLSSDCDERFKIFEDLSILQNSSTKIEKYKTLISFYHKLDQNLSARLHYNYKYEEPYLVVFPR